MRQIFQAYPDDYPKYIWLSPWRMVAQLLQMLAVEAKFVLLQGFFAKLIAKFRPLSALVRHRHVFAIHLRDPRSHKQSRTQRKSANAHFYLMKEKNALWILKIWISVFSLRAHARIPRREEIRWVIICNGLIIKIIISSRSLITIEKTYEMTDRRKKKRSSWGSFALSLGEIFYAANGELRETIWEYENT